MIILSHSYCPDGVTHRLHETNKHLIKRAEECIVNHFAYRNCDESVILDLLIKVPLCIPSSVDCASNLLACLLMSLYRLIPYSYLVTAQKEKDIVVFQSYQLTRSLFIMAHRKTFLWLCDLLTRHVIFRNDVSKTDFALSLFSLWSL